MLLRVIAEFLPVAEGIHFSAIESLPVLCSADDFGDVVGIAIHRHATSEDLEGHALFFQVTVIGADQGRELGSSGMATHKNAFWVPSIPVDVAVHPS